MDFAKRLTQLIDLQYEGNKKKFSEAGKIPYTSVVEYTKGDKNNPPLAFILKCIKAFKNVNTLWLITGEGDPDSRQVATITKDKRLKFLRTVPIVDIQAAATYNLNYGKSGYLENLSTMMLPEAVAGERECFIFQYWGDSMYSTLFDGDYIIASLVDPGEWENVNDNSVCVVVTKSRGIDIKRISNQLHDSSQLRCRADNMDSPSYSIKQDDILQLWEASAKLSFNMSNKTESLVNRLDALEQRLEKLELNKSHKSKI